jgi:hypothetical protein
MPLSPTPWHAKTRRGTLVLAWAAIALAGCRPLLAGPPYLTDDPAPVELRHWEAYLFTVGAEETGARDVAAPACELNYGAAPDLQLHLVVPWQWSREAGGPTRSGWGDVEIGAKYRLVQETAHRAQVGVFPMAELASGDAGRGLGNGRAWLRLPLWIQKSWAPWTTYGGAGWVLNPAPRQRDHAFAGWLVQRALGARGTLGGEVFWEGGDSAGVPSTTIANLGGTLELGPGFDLLYSAGRSVRGERRTIGYLGLYWTWGPGPSSER